MSFIEGELTKYIFYSEDTSYSVLKIDVSNTNDPELIRFEPTLTVCGFFPKLKEHMKYKFIGELTYHKTYGIQFNAKQFELIIDENYEGIIDYLSSDIFPGIGVKTAERIVDTLGIDCLSKISEDQYVLDQVPKLNDKLKKVIHKGIISNKEMENTLIWLYGFSISPSMAMKIYQKYGVETKQILRENPYILIDELEGVGFKRADEIGLKVGFKFDSDVRIAAVIYYLLNEYMNKFGDTYLELDDLIKYTLQFLNKDRIDVVEEESVLRQVGYLTSQKKLIQLETKIALFYLYQSERYIASKLNQFIDLNQDIFEVDDHLEAFESMNKIKYTNAQRKAIRMALSERVSIITGGPGTGKTTVIKGLIYLYKLMHQHKFNQDDIMLAAPTGKAAKRLSESTGLPASTIHKMLGYDFDGTYRFNANHPLNTKLLIIDEASMIDCLLMKRLLEAVKPITSLVLVGDANQLPSVGPGEVLNDIIISELYAVQKLDTIHRQAHDSNIISLAYDILDNQTSIDLMNHYHDRTFVRVKDEFVVAELVKQINQLVNHGYSLFEDIQILAPMYKGVNGIDRLNLIIQNTFNGQNKELSLSFGDKVFYYQDKVMQLSNQPEKNVMNGDQGIIVAIDDQKELIVDFSGTLVKYHLKELDQLTLAYVTSIHKSQGSEYKVVILPVSMSYYIMLKKKLLYTAVTRAKERLIIIGNPEAFSYGVSGMEKPRKTLLKDFMIECHRLNQQDQVRIEDFLDE